MTHFPFPYKPDLQFTNYIFPNIRHHHNQADMGQYFELFNIDEALYTVKSYLGASQGGGKFGEWYFGKDGKILMDFLTVPKVKLPEDPLEGQYPTSVNRYVSPSTTVDVNPNSYAALAFILSPANFSSRFLTNWTT